MFMKAPSSGRAGYAACWRDAVDSDPLVGMGLCYDHELVIQVVEAGTVRIEALC